jgi:hypothetical protein
VSPNLITESYYGDTILIYVAYDANSIETAPEKGPGPTRNAEGDHDARKQDPPPILEAGRPD